ncbi:hypothetical protein JB92DRAFT_951286 [Gautieria morchelliformis]|nr:hypothetical protein JB92DRAFT_951286 [Gautieria morchelliformis]
MSPYYTMTMFAQEVSFKAPPLSPAAILSFCPRADACLVRWAHRSPNSENPQFDERVETAKRLLASSVAGLDTLPGPAEYSLVNHLFSTPSQRFDDDWLRLLVSRKVEQQHTQPDHPQDIFSSGFLQTISGTWEGRMEYPDYNQYMSLHDSISLDTESYNSLYITSVSLSCHFQVFYCTSSLDLLRMPQDRDSILNAWFPPQTEIEITHTTQGVCILLCVVPCNSPC